MSDQGYKVRLLEREDREWVANFLDKRWMTTQIVSRGKIVYGHLLPGFVVEGPAEAHTANDTPSDEPPASEAQETQSQPGPRRVGLLTYNLLDDDCEVTTIDSVTMGRGIGTLLMEAMIRTAKDSRFKRLWLVTTNDNLPALRFYQKRGFRLCAVHRDAVAQSRRLKPQIPLVGHHGIPIMDEIELEYPLR